MRRIILIFGMICLIGCLLIENQVDDSVAIYKEEEVRSVFISYMELSNQFNNVSYDIAKSNVLNMINNIKNEGFNEIIVQVRSFMDAIYKSNIFPWSRYLTGIEGKDPGYDLLNLLSFLVLLNHHLK